MKRARLMIGLLCLAATAGCEELDSTLKNGYQDRAINSK